MKLTKQAIEGHNESLAKAHKKHFDFVAEGVADLKPVL